MMKYPGRSMGAFALLTAMALEDGKKSRDEMQMLDSAIRDALKDEKKIIVYSQKNAKTRKRRRKNRAARAARKINRKH